MKSKRNRGLVVAIAPLMVWVSMIITTPTTSASSETKTLIQEITYQSEKDGNSVYEVIDIYLLKIDGHKYIVYSAKDYLTPGKGWDIFGDGLWYTWPSRGNSAWIQFTNPMSSGILTSFTAFTPDCHVKRDAQGTVTYGLSATAGYASTSGAQGSGTAWVTWTTTIYNEEMWPDAMQQHKAVFSGKLNGAHNHAHVFSGGVTQQVVRNGYQYTDYQIGGYFSHNNWLTWTKVKIWIHGTLYTYVS